MWCIGQMTQEYQQRMNSLLALYARAYNPQEPVVCLDEKSKQLLAHTRRPLAAQVGVVAKEDYEYRRQGTCNIFVAVEPQGGQRQAEVTVRRTKVDFVGFVRKLVESVYARAQKVHLVLDNLNTHFRASFEEVMGAEPAQALLARVEFHYTPKHASWLNMAELEIGIMERQCTGRRMGSLGFVAAEIAAWQNWRNHEQRKIQWTFTQQDADRKLARHYVA